jgi:hypothetical protein
LRSDIIMAANRSRSVACRLRRTTALGPRWRQRRRRAETGLPVWRRWSCHREGDVDGELRWSCRCEGNVEGGLWLSFRRERDFAGDPFLNCRRHGDGAEMKLQVLACLCPSDGSISFSHACFFWTGLRGRRAELSSSLLQPPYMYEPLVRSHLLG